LVFGNTHPRTYNETGLLLGMWGVGEETASKDDMSWAGRAFVRHQSTFKQDRQAFESSSCSWCSSGRLQRHREQKMSGEVDAVMEGGPRKVAHSPALPLLLRGP
jgi:hypothetical protein